MSSTRPMQINSKNLHLCQKIKELIYHPSYIEEKLPYFLKKENWNKFCDFDYHYEVFLRPFNKNYFSPLNPLFLFELNNEPLSLKSFPLITARDGAISLLKFFNRYPNPPENFPFLLIEKKLHPLIPPSWLEQTGIFRLVKNDYLTPVPSEKINSVFIFFMAEPQQATIEYTRNIFQKIIDYIGKDEIKNKNIYTVTKNDFNYSIHQRYYEEKFLSFYEFNKLYDEFFPHNRREILPVELDSLNKKNSLFTVINQDNFFFSDDIFSHEMLTDGAFPINFDEISPHNSSNVISLSPYHGLEISSSICEKVLPILNKVEDIRTGYYKDILTHEPYTHLEDENKFCSELFFDFTFSVMEILKKNEKNS